jgi:hypothetical protein
LLGIGVKTAKIPTLKIGQACTFTIYGVSVKFERVGTVVERDGDKNEYIVECYDGSQYVVRASTNGKWESGGKK